MSTPTTPGITPPESRPSPVVDQAIQAVERLYQAVTGRSPPAEAARAPIPPEADAFDHVQRQLERLIGEVEGSSSAASVWGPRLSVWEADDNLAVAIEVPGVPRDAIEVTVTGNLLTISGERTAPWSASTARVHVNEAVVGRFRRSVALPPRVRLDQMNAQLRDGILEVRIPLAAEASSPQRTVPVR